MYQLKADEIKRNIENCYEFSAKKAFSWIDDWNYSYIDQHNLQRFLKSNGYKASKQEIVCILRRFDMDGDAKIGIDEFKIGLKSQLCVFNRREKRRPKTCSINHAKAKIPANSLFQKAKKLYLESKENTAPKRKKSIPKTKELINKIQQTPVHKRKVSFNQQVVEQLSNRSS